MNLGDTVYVVRHHIKNKKNIGYYIDKCRLCDEEGRYLYVDHDIEGCDNLPNKKGKRIYKRTRIYKTIEEAQKECNFKNDMIEVRKKYNQDINKIAEKERFYGI